ncbi:hypothetical protein ACHAO1_004555, partial [Botrytis cinerea]
MAMFREQHSIPSLRRIDTNTRMLVKPEEMPELKNEVAIQRAAQQVKDRVYEEAHAQKRRTKKASLECNRQDLINAAQNKATEERANMKRKEKHRSRRDVALTAIYTPPTEKLRELPKRETETLKNKGEQRLECCPPPSTSENEKFSAPWIYSEHSDTVCQAKAKFGNGIYLQVRDPYERSFRIPESGAEENFFTSHSS